MASSPNLQDPKVHAALTRYWRANQKIMIGLLAVWDDGDDSHSEPRAPYPQVRDVLVLRAATLRCPKVSG